MNDGVSKLLRKITKVVSEKHSFREAKYMRAQQTGSIIVDPKSPKGIYKGLKRSYRNAVAEKKGAEFIKSALASLETYKNSLASAHDHEHGHGHHHHHEHSH
jgi:hypothetical protein